MAATLQYDTFQTLGTTTELIPEPGFQPGGTFRCTHQLLSGSTNKTSDFIGLSNGVLEN